MADAQTMDIPIAKAGGETITVDLTKIPNEMIEEIYHLGLKSLLTRSMSKITGEKSPEKSKAALAAAQENLEKLYKGELRKTSGAKRQKTGGEVMTEARRLAKAEVKVALKEAGHKVSYIPASEITRLANELLASDDGKEIIETAKATVAARTQKAKGGVKIDLKSVKVDQNLIDKAEKTKAERKARSEAKKEAAKGKTLTPAKGQQPHAAARH